MARPLPPGGALPPSLFGFVWRLSATDQVWIGALSVAVALLDTVPIEVQRRVVNTITDSRDYGQVLFLTGLYAALVACQGGAKLLLNLYRSWVGEHSVRALRIFINGIDLQRGKLRDEAEARGVEISMIIAESDPVGSFVGLSISEPLLQIGVLVTVFGYLTYLRPLLALVTFLVLSPQLIFIPLIQRMINRQVERRVAALRKASAGTLSEQTTAEMRQRHQETRFTQIFRFNMGIFKLKFSLNFLMNFTHHLGIAVVLGAGGWFVVNRQVEVGTVVAFISGLSTVRDPWGDLVLWYQNLMMTKTKYRLIADAVASV
jgi:ABC-type bacteriocin/lantibiotic exporter with double-glycine peptidase domain